MALPRDVESYFWVGDDSIPTKSSFGTHYQQIQVLVTGFMLPIADKRSACPTNADKRCRRHKVHIINLNSFSLMIDVKKVADKLVRLGAKRINNCVVRSASVIERDGYNTIVLRLNTNVPMMVRKELEDGTEVWERGESNTVFITSISLNAVVYDLFWYNSTASNATKVSDTVLKAHGIWRGNEACSLIDIRTGKHFRIHIQSTGHHVDAEPLTSSDTSVLCSLYGVSSASNIS